MKHLSKIMSLIAVAFMLLIPTIENSKAQGYGGQAVRVLYGATPVGTTTWVPVVAQLSRSISGITIANTSAVVLKVGTIPASGSANTEAQRLIVPASSVATFYPIQVSAGWRVSILAYTSTASVGEGDFNFYYQ